MIKYYAQNEKQTIPWLATRRSCVKNLTISCTQAWQSRGSLPVWPWTRWLIFFTGRPSVGSRLVAVKYNSSRLSFHASRMTEEEQLKGILRGLPFHPSGNMLESQMANHKWRFGKIICRFCRKPLRHSIFFLHEHTSKEKNVEVIVNEFR